MLYAWLGSGVGRIAPAIVRPELPSTPTLLAVSKLELSMLLELPDAMKRSSIAVITALGVLLVSNATFVPASGPVNVMLNGPPLGPLTDTLPASAGIVFRLFKTSKALVPATPVWTPLKPTGNKALSPLYDRYVSLVRSLVSGSLETRFSVCVVAATSVKVTLSL